MFKKWLKEEKISLEENNLKLLYTTRIGFPTNCWSREAFGKLYEEQMKKVLGPRCLESTCYSDTLTIGDNTARFMMIKTKNKNAEQ
jgi:hypothetical protein